MRRFWNANIQYHQVVLAALPQGAKCVLDVGCGDGILLAELIDAGAPHVIGLDSDRNCLTHRPLFTHLAQAIAVK